MTDSENPAQRELAAWRAIALWGGVGALGNAGLIFVFFVLASSDALAAGLVLALLPSVPLGQTALAAHQLARGPQPAPGAARDGLRRAFRRFYVGYPVCLLAGITLAVVLSL